MADDNYMHTAELMKAALPYVDEKAKASVEFMYKFIDFMGYFRTMTQPTDSAARGFENQKINIEGLLTGIRPFCNDRERPFIDQILNIFNMKRMFETYSKMMQTMKDMPGFEGFQNAFASGNATGATGGGPAGFDLSSLFGSLFNQNAAPTQEKSPDLQTDFNKESHQKDPPNNDLSNMFSNMFSNMSQSDTKTAPPQDTGSESQTGSNYNDMINMLKSMIPEDKRESYENLGMLFKDSSYDNNSLNDQNKE